MLGGCSDTSGRPPSLSGPPTNLTSTPLTPMGMTPARSTECPPGPIASSSGAQPSSRTHLRFVHLLFCHRYLHCYAHRQAGLHGLLGCLGTQSIVSKQSCQGCSVKAKVSRLLRLLCLVCKISSRLRHVCRECWSIATSAYMVDSLASGGFMLAAQEPAGLPTVSTGS